MNRGLNAQLAESLKAIRGLAGGRVCGIALGFLITVVTARELGVRDFGVYSLIITLFGYTAILGEGGLRTTILSEVTRHGESRSLLVRYLRARCLVCFLLFSVVLAATIFVVPKYLGIVAVVFSSLLLLPFYMDWVLIARGRFDVAGLVIAARWLAFLVIILLLSAFSWLDLLTSCYAFTAAWFVAVAYSLRVSIHKTKDLIFSPAPEQIAADLTPLFLAGMPVLAGQLFCQLIQTADVVWVGLTETITSVGTYHIANSIASALLLVVNALSQVMLCRYADSDMTAKEVKKLFSYDIVFVSLSAIVLCSSVFFSRSLISSIFGPHYTLAIEMLGYFFPYVFSYHIFMVVFCVLIAQNRQTEIVRALPLTLILFLSLFVIAEVTNDLRAVALVKGLGVALAALFLTWRLREDWGVYYCRVCSISLLIPSGWVLLELLLGLTSVATD